jgi:hypothetical protein
MLLDFAHVNISATYNSNCFVIFVNHVKRPVVEFHNKYEILECVEIIWIKIGGEIKYRSVCKIVVVLWFYCWGNSFKMIYGVEGLQFCQGERESNLTE